MKSLNIKMPERNPEHAEGWYNNDDGFAETLQEIVSQIEDRNHLASPAVLLKLDALKEEIAKFKPATE